MKRENLMLALYNAGQHNDTEKLMRLYCENNISWHKAKEQFDKGTEQRVSK